MSEDKILENLEGAVSTIENELATIKAQIGKLWQMKAKKERVKSE